MSTVRTPARGATTTSLPADPRSPALARRHVAAAARAAGLDALLDEALLLVSELVTNAVVHAGTAVELRLDTSGPGLRVEVVDGTPAATALDPRAASDSREGGRGLYLLDALATTWGTTHTATGKSVWFLLGGQPAVAAPRQAADPPRATTGSLGWLLGLPPDLERRLSPPRVCQELLQRLVDAHELEQACLLVDDAGSWSVYSCTGGGVDGATAEQLRRASTGDPVVSTRTDAGLLVLLHSGGGVVGGLLLQGSGGGVPELDDEAVAVARLVADRLGVVVRDELASTAQLRSRGSLALLAEASELFAGTLDVQLAVTLAAQLVVPRFATWSALWVTNGREPSLAAVAHRDETRIAPLRVALSGGEGTSFVAAALGQLDELRPVLLSGALPVGLLDDVAGDLLAVPLVVRRRLVGLLVMARDGSYADDDIGLLHDLGRRAAVAVDNARLYEERTEIAQALQASLLPPELPLVPGIDLGARYAAAGEGNEVGGDFYDVFGLDDGGWALAIGDVCGKGAEAAAITGLARDVLRLLVREGRPSSEVFRRLNEAILELGERGRFCTAALATAHRTDEGLRVRLSNAGHPPPVLVTAAGECRFVGRSGTLLGVMPDVDVPDDDLVLADGDALVFYTDGVTERRDGATMYGEESLLAALATQAGGDADALAAHLARSVRSFGSDTARDDMAVLVLRAVPVESRVTQPV